jgi:hypothetical protein
MISTRKKRKNNIKKKQIKGFEKTARNCLRIMQGFTADADFQKPH